MEERGGHKEKNWEHARNVSEKKDSGLYEKEERKEKERNHEKQPITRQEREEEEEGL